jgi:hypothetical protein
MAQDSALLKEIEGDHPRGVFRPVIVVAGTAIILAHNLCAARIYVQVAWEKF